MNIKKKITLVITVSVLSVFYANAKELAPEENSDTTSIAKVGVTYLRADDLTTIVGGRGVLENGQKGQNTISGFRSPEDTITFTVNAPKEDDFAISLIFSSPDSHVMELRSGDSVVSAPSMLKTWDDRPIYWRQHMPGVLRLKAGENQITFRLPEIKSTRTKKPVKTKISSEPDEFTLFSIELGTPSARAAQLERAKEIRSDATWMVEGKYGLFVHWSGLSQPFMGNRPRGDWFQESVKLFDVQVFADAVERTGAAWVTFTATHKGMYWPGPNAALDKIDPGRTSERDLLGEIIDELDSRGIATLFYFHSGYNGHNSDEWRQVVGAKDDDTQRYNDNIVSILREVSLRYGKKLKGFGYIDGCLQHDYPLNPHWESWARAIKAGNPDALVGFSANRGPTVSPFSDLATTDGGGKISMPEPSQIGPGKQLGDVAPAWWCFMDTWFFAEPLNGKFELKPRHSKQEYVDYFKKMDQAGIPVTINLSMTADVTSDHPIFDPECIAIMDDVRKAIRGK